MSSDDSYDFDGIFNSNSGLTEQDVRRIASDQHFRDLAAMQQAGQVIGERRAAALERAESRHPGFRDTYYNTEVTDRFMKEHQRATEWIRWAEAGGGTEQDLDELYDSFHNAASQYESSPQQAQRVVKQAPGGPFSLEVINKLPAERRRERIEELKDRVGDRSIDEADPSNEVFKIERGGE